MGQRRSRTPRAGSALLLVVAMATTSVLTGLSAAGAPAQTPAFLPAILSVVRVGNDGSFDRVVFEFVGDTVPTATLDGPMTNPGSVPSDPSNQPVPIAGASVVTVHMTPAIATYAASNPPQVYTGPDTFSPITTANVVQVTQTGDFESVLSWSIGLKVGTAVTVQVLTNPTRVVVDVPHVAAAPAQPVAQTPVLTG